MAAWEVSTPAIAVTGDSLVTSNGGTDTVHDRQRDADPHNQSAGSILTRVVSAFRALPGFEQGLAPLENDESFLKLPKDEALQRILTQALTLSTVQSIIGDERDSLRSVFARANSLSETARTRFPVGVNPFVVMQKDQEGADTKYGVVEAEVGRGGCGYVEKVVFAGRRLARKVFHPDRSVVRDLPKLRKRFVNEFLVMKELGSNVPRAEFSVGFDDDSESPSFTMEFLDGATIAHIQAALDQEEGERPTRWLLLLYASIAKAVSSVHTLHGTTEDATADSVTFIENSVTEIESRPKTGLVHRDLKPQNIQLTSSGQVKVFDFGMAHTDDTRDYTMTATGDILGTPLYMAPELYDQKDNIKNATTASDVYAVGVMLFESLTGKHPFENHKRSQLRLLQAHQQEFPNFDCIAEGPLRNLLMRMLAKKREARPSMSEVASVLHQQFMQGASEQEQAEYASFLEVPPEERRVPLPQISDVLLRAQDPTGMGELQDLNRTGVNAGENTVLLGRDNQSLSMQLTGEIPNATEEPLVIDSPKSATYEVDSRTGLPVRIGSLRRLARNRVLQTVGGAAVLATALIAAKVQFSDRGKADAKKSLSSVIDNSKSEQKPKEPTMPRIPSALRNRTAAEADQNLPAFGIDQEGGVVRSVNMFGKIVDGKNFYTLVPSSGNTQQDLGVSFTYLSDEDLATGVFGIEPKELEKIPAAQKLVDISETLGPSNKYPKATGGKVAGGRECYVWHNGDAYMMSVQGICYIIGGKGPQSTLYTRQEFSSYFSHWSNDLEVRGSYLKPGDMMFDVYTDAGFLKNMPPPDQMLSLSDERPFSHLPVGENSGVDARMRKGVRGVLNYIQDPGRVQQQEQQNQQSARSAAQSPIRQVSAESPESLPQSP